MGPHAASSEAARAPALAHGLSNTVIPGLPFRLAEPKRGHRTGPESAVLGELLGHHAARHVVDLGAGSAILGLLAAHVGRGVETLDLVERNPEFAAYAAENVARAQRPARIIVDDIADFDPGNIYDLVVTNPPWFDPGAGRESSNPLSHAATHALFGGYEIFLSAAKRCVTRDGAIWIGTPADRVCDLLAEALLQELHPASLVLLHARHTGRPYRTWIELRCEVAPLRRVDLGVATTR